MEKEAKFFDKMNTLNANLPVTSKDNEDKSSIAQTEQLRQSLISEVELDIRQIAKKKALNDFDLETYKKIDLGELHSELGDMLDEKDVSFSPNKHDENNEEIDNKSEADSMYNVFWEEFEQRENRRKEKDLQMLNDPMLLLEKLEVYSKNLYRNLSVDDKNELLSQIEHFLDEGVTPLKKYYDELKKKFTVPSKSLIDYEKKEFQRQVGLIRKAQKKEIEQIKYIAEVKAKKIATDLIAVANITVKREMNNIIKQFNQMNKDLINKQEKIYGQEITIKTQEKTINEIRMMLFQSTSRQVLDKIELEKLDKFLNSNILSKEQIDVNDIVKMFLKSEKPASELIEKEKFMENPFSFYTSYMSIAMSERESIITNDLVRRYKAMITELELRVRIKEKELSGSLEMNSYYAVQINDLADHIDKQKQQIIDLKKDIEYNKNRYEKQINDMNLNFLKEQLEKKKENAVSLDLLLREIDVRERIQNILIENERKFKDEIIAMKHILMVPKLQYKYIENMNFEALKSENERIVNNEINKIARKLDHSHDKPKINRSLPFHRRSKSSLKDPSLAETVSNFAFADKSRKFSLFFNSKMRISPLANNEKLPNIMNKTTDSMMTTMRSFRYDRSSPILDMSTILNTSEASKKIIERNRELGGSKQDIMLSQISELEMN